MKILLGLLLLSTPAVTQAAESFVIQDFAQFGIAAQVRKLQSPRLEKLEYSEDKYYLEVTLGRLTQDQYKAMRALYGNISQVPYSATKVYDLLDFVHPAIQATANQVLEPITYDTESLFDLDMDSLSEDGQMVMWGVKKSGLSYFSNCWNTTSQILNLMNPSAQKGKMRYSIYWPGRDEMSLVFQDNELSTMVKEKSLNYGDAMLIFNHAPAEHDMAQIQHTALILSRNLVFEKTDGSENDPYRISLRADVLKKYKAVFEGQAHIQYRRFNQAGKEPFHVDGTASTLRQSLPEADAKIVADLAPDIMDIPLTAGCEERLGGGCDVTNSEKATFEVIVNPKTGRGIFNGPKKYLDRFKSLKGS